MSGQIDFNLVADLLPIADCFLGVFHHWFVKTKNLNAWKVHKQDGNHLTPFWVKIVMDPSA